MRTTTVGCLHALLEGDVPLGPLGELAEDAPGEACSCGQWGPTVRWVPGTEEALAYQVAGSVLAHARRAAQDLTSWERRAEARRFAARAVEACRGTEHLDDLARHHQRVLGALLGTSAGPSDVRWHLGALCRIGRDTPSGPDARVRETLLVTLVQGGTPRDARDRLQDARQRARYDRDVESWLEELVTEVEGGGVDTLVVDQGDLPGHQLEMLQHRWGSALEEGERIALRVPRGAARCLQAAHPQLWQAGLEGDSDDVLRTFLVLLPTRTRADDETLQESLAAARRV